MGKTFIAGLLVIAAAVLAIVLDGALGLGLGSVLLGVAIGGALGLSTDGTPIGRLGAFLVGFLVALVGYLIRILLLNESTLGSILHILLVLGLVTVICGVTKNRLPLLSGLLGIAAMVGAYEFAFASSPANIQTEIFEYASRVLVPVALGFLATLFASAPDVESAAPEPAPSGQATYGSDTPDTTDFPQNSEV